MTVPRRQHYVWKHYLKAWSVDGQLSVLRADGKAYRTNPNNVAVQRDFYRLAVLSQSDEEFIRRVIAEISSPTLRALGLQWLDILGAPSRWRRSLSIPPGSSRLDGIIADIEIMAEERFHSEIENDAVALLEDLRNGSRERWDDVDGARSLSFFLALQLLRTKRSRDQVLEGYPSGTERERVARCWPILRVIFATNIATVLSSKRLELRCRLLTADDQHEFITTDQPVVNLDDGLEPDSLALYYPLSPNMAMLLEYINRKSFVETDDIIPDGVVEWLNRKMFAGSHELVIGRQFSVLTDLRSTI